MTSKAKLCVAMYSSISKGSMWRKESEGRNSIGDQAGRKGENSFLKRVYGLVSQYEVLEV
jgi:hypothetical protein